MDMGKYRRIILQKPIVVLGDNRAVKGYSPDNIRSGHEAPDARVATDCPVISQHKIFVGRHPQVCNSVRARRYSLVLRSHIRFVERHSIDDYSGTVNGDDVPGNADDALHKILLRIRWSDKDDHISPRWLVEHIGPLVHQNKLRVV